VFPRINNFWTSPLQPNSPIPDTTATQQAKKRENLIFPRSSQEQVRIFNQRNPLFPACVEISLKKQIASAHLNLMSKSGFILALMKLSLQKKLKNEEELNTHYRTKTSLSFPERISTDTPSLSHIDIEEFLNSFLQTDFAGQLDHQLINENSLILRHETEDEENMLLPEKKLLRVFFGNIMKAAFDTMKHDLCRKPSQVFGGQMAYREPLFFRVDKHRVLSDGTVEQFPIQRFWLENDDKDTISLYDTQVKYGKKYVYRIF